MHIDEIKSLIKRTPFKPFTMSLPNGANIKVLNADHVAVNPYTGELHLFAPGQVIYVASEAVVLMTDGDLVSG